MACFLCNNQNVKEHPSLNINCYFYDCPNCGKYGVNGDIHKNWLKPSDMGGNSFEEFRNKATCVATARNIKEMDEFLLLPDNLIKDWKIHTAYSPIGITNFLKEYPKDAVEMFDRILLTLGRLIKHPTDDLEVNYSDDKQNNAIFYSANKIQTMDMTKELENLGWTRSMNASGQSQNVKITPNGWKHLAELREARAFEHSNKVFLAMWFDESTNNFREAVRKAVELAGYYPEYITVDEVDHNDFIMDKVTNMITGARFVIADFTCAPEGTLDNGKIPGGVRGGVYFEAGLARGQGKEVIHTCKDDDNVKSRLHFDIHQINTIFWKEENGVLTSYGNNFIDLLKDRIIATVGKGKHQ